MKLRGVKLSKIYILYYISPEINPNKRFFLIIDNVLQDFITKIAIEFIINVMRKIFTVQHLFFFSN